VREKMAEPVTCNNPDCEGQEMDLLSVPPEGETYASFYNEPANPDDEVYRCPECGRAKIFPSGA
jgi:hypothetical protein